MQNTTCAQTTSLIQYISPAIAFMAVLFGPLLTVWMTGRQIKEAKEAEFRRAAEERKLANKQIVAPMRQAWIEKLRAEIALFVSLCNRFAARGTTDEDALYDQLSQLIFSIRLRLNPAEDDHIDLANSLEELFVTVSVDTILSQAKWLEVRQKQQWIIDKAGRVFKKEWNRVKSEDAN